MADAPATGGMKPDFSGDESYITNQNLMTSIQKQSDRVKVLLKEMEDTEKDGVSPALMFKLQVAMQLLQMLTDTASSVMAGLHSSMQGMARTLKG